MNIFQAGAKHIRDTIERNSSTENNLFKDLQSFFSVTWDRFEGGWRPDVLVNQSEVQIASLESSKVTTKSSSVIDFPTNISDSRELDFFSEMGADYLLIPIDSMTEKIKHCNFLLEAQVTEPALQRLSKDILMERGPLPVGEIGKMLQEITSISTLSAYLKEKYGGLKKFLERFDEDFIITTDHPFNPHVFLRKTLTEDEIMTILTYGTIPLHLSSKANKRRLSRRKKATNSTGGSERSERNRLHSNSFDQERNNSVNSHSSYNSQQSIGHTTNSVSSGTPTPPGSFYSCGPPDTQGNGNLSPFYVDRRRTMNIGEVLSNYEGDDNGFNFNPKTNRRTIPNQSFRIESIGESFEFFDDIISETDNSVYFPKQY
jgi:hypothetical protein